jgi:hypothetical protein
MASNRRHTEPIDAEPLERMRLAAEADRCVECARREGAEEGWRKERHSLHMRIGQAERRVEELEARLVMVGQLVARLAEQVDALTGGPHAAAR